MLSVLAPVPQVSRGPSCVQIANLIVAQSIWPLFSSTSLLKFSSLLEMLHVITK